MRKRKRRISFAIAAGTLVETLVSLTILSLVSAFAIVIFIQVSGPGSSIEAMVRAQQKSAEIMDSLAVSQNIAGTYTEFQAGNLWYTSDIAEYAPDVWQVNITVKDNRQRIIYSRKRLFYEPRKD